MKRPTIGILGGIGPESSAFFYKRIIELVQQRYSISSNTDYPHILLEHITIYLNDKIKGEGV
jgi:aspartate/glutamate racemase